MKSLPVQLQKRALELCEAAMDRDDPRGWLWKNYAAELEQSPHLATVVLELLEEVAEVPDDLESAAVVASVPTIGSEIGGYRLTSRIARGGVGTVYKAERVGRSFRQEVALKILNTRLLSSDMLAKFSAERRILAALQHPYIAVLIDGGTTPEGVPFLVMEMVDGVPITSHCDRRRLDTGARIDLLVQVGTALQAAHAKLVLHQDVKPGNVLVTREGIPKLVDFGVARFSEEDDHASRPSGAGAAFTADYASPEQIAGEPVTTASDVYSLGVLAYELLTGVRPYALKGRSRRRLRQSVQDASILTPADAVAQLDGPMGEGIARSRGTTVRVLSRQLSGDLGAVLLKAMATDPEQRYDSVAAFAADLRAVRNIRPVSAREATTWYQLGTFVRARKLPVMLAVAAVLSLAVGLTVALWQTRVAHDRFQDLHGFSQAMMGDVYDQLADLPGTTVARERMTLEVKRYLDRLRESMRTDDGLTVDVARAYRRLAEVQGLPSTANLGQSEKALENLAAALEIAAELDAADPARFELLTSIRRITAEIQAWRGRLPEAVAELQSVHQLILEHYRGAPADESALTRLAFSHVKLGDILGHPHFPNVGDVRAAEAEYEKALALFPQAAASKPGWAVRRAQGVVLERLGTMRLEADDTTGALAYFERSGEIRRALTAEQPHHQDIYRDYGIAIEKVAHVHRSVGSWSLAEANYREALQVYRELAERDPSNTNAQRTLAVGLRNLAGSQAALGRLEVALDSYRQAAALHRDLVALDPGAVRLERELEDLIEEARTRGFEL